MYVLPWYECFSWFFRLAFRCLVRKYDCDVCFTPMIIAADFMRSAKARDSEFTTNKSKPCLLAVLLSRWFSTAFTLFYTVHQNCHALLKEFIVQKWTEHCHHSWRCRQPFTFHWIACTAFCSVIRNLLSWQTLDRPVCCKGCTYPGRSGMCGFSFLRWGGLELWLSTKVMLILRVFKKCVHIFTLNDCWLKVFKAVY